MPLRLCLILVLTSVMLVSPSPTSAVVLFPSPVEQTTTVGSTFPVQLLLDSRGDDVNVVSLTLRYPTELLDVVDLIDGRSILSLWVERPKDDAAGGAVTLAGGIPKGAVVLNAEVLTILFRARAKGTGTITVDAPNSQVLLDDGFGTATTVDGRSMTVTITETDPLRPRIESASHPDEGRWSTSRDLSLTWRTYRQALYSYQLSRDQTVEPDDAPDSPVGLAYYPALADGLWFFSLKEKLPGETGWGAVARRQIMIDSTPPEPLVVELVREPRTGRWLLTFGTRDAVSGVERYEVQFLSSRLRWFPFFLTGDWRRAQSPLDLGTESFVGSVVVRALDNAGNQQSAVLTSPTLQRDQQRFFLLLGSVVLALVIAELALLFRRRRAAGP